MVINPELVAANSITTVTVSATDPDNDILSYAYSVNGGAISGDGPIVEWTAPPLAGAYGITVTVGDGKGGIAVNNGSLTVTPAQTQIVGTVIFPPGPSGDLSKAKVGLYTSYNNWVDHLPVKSGEVDGSGSSVTFSLSDVVPGNYYLDVWKNNDNDDIWSVGDFVGWYGSGDLSNPSLIEIQIQEGQTIPVSVNMWIL